MIYQNKITGEKVKAEQFSPENIIARYASVKVKSKEGATVNMEAGDWVVQNGTRVYVVRKDTFNKLYELVQGELYPCKPDIFEQTYEVLEDDNSM